MTTDAAPDPQLTYSSIPPWARSVQPSSPTIDPSGSDYLCVAIGSSTAALATAWWSDIPDGRGVRTIYAADTADLEGRLPAEIAASKVGLRLVVAGPSGACLRVRAMAVTLGLADDEMSFYPTQTGPIEVTCAHCRAVTATNRAIGEIVECSGCRRALLVYYHLSRRTGTYLGFMADAQMADAQTAQVPA